MDLLYREVVLGACLDQRLRTSRLLPLFGFLVLVDELLLQPAESEYVLLTLQIRRGLHGLGDEAAQLDVAGSLLFSLLEPDLLPDLSTLLDSDRLLACRAYFYAR
jgi:hypothetical protein